MKQYLTIILVILALICNALGPACAQAAPTESQVKVAMIFNMAKFVEWPASALPQTADTLQVCYLGDSSLTDEIALLHNKTIKNRTLAVRQVDRIEDIGSCQVLIVSKDYHDNIAFIKDRQRLKGVFTVSDMDGFAVNGGMVQFYLEDGKIRFKINHAAFKEAQLAISAQVLKLAAEVIE